MAYASCGVKAKLAGFFGDVPERLQRAQLVISRAGASTVAELKAIGRPALLVPYPHAADDHQSANAEVFCDAGGAWLMPQTGFTPEALCHRLEALISLPDRLQFAAQCALAQGVPDAAERLAALTLEVAHLRGPQVPSLGRSGTQTANSAPQTARGTACAAMEVAA
jgi:UDP-N-acetylglucosamine--N-acetylmuramyl-(pentapeptide) pyrophosphoryl-undecaprenol N-acetylglucosamine transferase